MGDLELFLHNPSPMPPLVKCALAHGQFETIHPFLDGNGRIGRLLITFLLCQQGILRRPLLYLTYFFKRQRANYYERLQAVRDRGDWEGWVEFFLSGVAEVAEQAGDTARQILRMQGEHRALIQSKVGTGSALRLHDHLFDRPVISTREASRFLGFSFQGANRLIRALMSAGLLREITGEEHYRLFTYEPYLALLREGTEPETQLPLPLGAPDRTEPAP